MKWFFVLGASVSVIEEQQSIVEGNEGDLSTVQICLQLEDIELGLERNLDFNLTVAFEDIGMCCCFEKEHQSKLIMLMSFSVSV